jgi:hypothetical protein
MPQGLDELLAVQVAVVPPLEPLHDHAHGPLPETVAARPVEQRLVVGLVDAVVPLASPHTPLIRVEALLMSMGAEQVAFVPPLMPVQDQLNAVRVLVTAEALPAEHKEVGLAAVLTPFEAPQAPFTLADVEAIETRPLASVGSPFSRSPTRTPATMASSS